MRGEGGGQVKAEEIVEEGGKIKADEVVEEGGVEGEVEEGGRR